MRKIVVLLVTMAVGYYAYTHQDASTIQHSPAIQTRADGRRSSDALSRAYDYRQSNIQVEASGVVTKILSDDNDGSRHQRFIVQLPSGKTVLIAHNIDLATRVAPLAAGDQVQFSGEYEWNKQGGVVHWTHRDPNGRHPAGWIKHDGKIVQ